MVEIISLTNVLIVFMEACFSMGEFWIVLFMSQGFVLLGDKTTHGGEVISASSTMIVNGKRVALVGDEVRCPLPGHGVNLIVDGCPDWSEGDRVMVINGCRCECDCQVISSALDCGVG